MTVRRILTAPRRLSSKAAQEGTRVTKGERDRSATIETRFDVLLQILTKQLPLKAAIANRQARIAATLSFQSCTSDSTLRKIELVLRCCVAKFYSPLSRNSPFNK